MQGEKKDEKINSTMAVLFLSIVRRYCFCKNQYTKTSGKSNIKVNSVKAARILREKNKLLIPEL